MAFEEWKKEVKKASPKKPPRAKADKDRNFVISERKNNDPETKALLSHTLAITIPSNAVDSLNLVAKGKVALFVDRDTRQIMIRKSDEGGITLRSSANAVFFHLPLGGKNNFDLTFADGANHQIECATTISDKEAVFVLPDTVDIIENAAAAPVAEAAE